MNKLSKMIDINFPTVQLKNSIDEAVKIFTLYEKNSIPVIDSYKNPCGVVSCRAVLGVENKDQSLSTILDKDFIIITSSNDLEKLLSDSISKINDLIIVTDEKGAYIGVITLETLAAILFDDIKYTENILNSIDAGIIAINTEKEVVFYNQEWKKIHSINGDQLLGEDILGKFPETLITATLEGNSDDISSEPLHLRYSGATVLPHYKAVFNDKNEIVGSVAIVKDYTKASDIALIVKELKSLNFLLSSIFNNLAEMVFCIDTNKIISYANPAFKNTFGLMSGEILNNEALDSIISEIFENKTRIVAKKEITISDRNGDDIDICLSLIPLVDSQNTMNGAICIIQDITSISKLKKEIVHSSNVIQYYEKQIKKIPQNMVCKNPNFKSVLSTALKVAKMDVTVLIEGESGVGKDMVANFIQMNSSRAEKPLIPVNCGSISESLWESEMYGYEEGSFTGAKKGGKLGIVELADQGTLFLDEIGMLSPAAQVKLLRFLENMEINKVGMTEIKKLDIRVIAASNYPLEKLVGQGKFREDLFYRLNVIRLEVPPLREREDEIMLLANSFVNFFSKKYNKEIAISSEASEILKNHKWPGNVRQLKNVIEHCVAMCDGIILPVHLPQGMLSVKKESLKLRIEGMTLQNRVQEVEREAIVEALKKTNNNRTKAIEILGISRKSFYSKLKEYKIN